MGDAKNAVKLVAAYTLLAGHHQVNGLQPQVQRQVAFLEDVAFAHGELATALAALPKAVTFFAFRVLLGGLSADTLKAVSLVHHTSVRACRTISPKHRFNVSKGGCFVVHVRGGQNGLSVNF